MTNFTTRMTIAAATLVVAAGVASAQTMKAEIPFPFRVGGALMTAGTYRVSLDYMGGSHMLYLLSVEGGHSAIVRPMATQDAHYANANGGGVMSFSCTASHCSLTGVWSGSGTPEYRFFPPKPAKDEPFHAALVALRPEKGD